NPFPENSGFFKTYTFAAVTKKLNVIDVHGRHNCTAWFEHIHRVKPATEPNLHHCQIDLLPHEAPHGSQRTKLKIGQLHILTSHFNCCKCSNQHLVIKFLEIDPDTLVVTQDMR